MLWLSAKVQVPEDDKDQQALCDTHGTIVPHETQAIVGHGLIKLMKSNKIASNCTTSIGKHLFPTIYIIIVLGVLTLPLFFIQAAFSKTDDINSRKNIAEDLNIRKVRVGCYENKPKIFKNKSGVLSGIFPTILNEIAREEKWQLTYVPCEWYECIDALQSGRIDLMPDVAFSLERREMFDFNTEPILSSWSSIYTRQSKEINNINDLNGLRVAVLKGSVQQKNLEQMAKGMDLKVSFIESRSFEEAFLVTAKGAADAAISNYYFGDYFHRQYGLKKTYVVLNPVTLHFATAHGANNDLLRAIDKNLLAMKAQLGSAYYKALQVWIKQPPKAAIPIFVIYLLCGLIGVSVLGFFTIWLLRRQVRAATMNLISTNIMLVESEKKFRDLFEKHTAVKLIINPENGNIVEANESAEKYYGWSQAELLRMSIQEINALSLEQVKVELEKVMQKKSSCFEYRHRLANGSLRDVEVFSSAVDINGKLFLHSIIHDITDKCRVEEQCRLAQKIEAVGQLVGGVAHDYNNMLSVILSYAELAKDQVDPAQSLYADLEEITKAAKRSTDITRQLLAFTSKHTVTSVVLDLNQTVESMLKMLRRLIDADIDLQWLPKVDLWPVKMDPGQVDQILVNLCVNARDAITDVGKITIETGNAVFDEADCVQHAGFIAGEYVLLAVSDNGSGMEKETLEKIFEPFFTSKGVGKGTGLGLSTVYGIVKQNKGFINVYSEPGEGTTFKIYLSRYTDQAGEIRPEVELKIPRGRGEVVLVVEDEPALLTLSKKMLETVGYQVLAAGSPSEAVRLANEHAGEIQLLITDLVMPEMNGRDLSEQLHALYPSLKILFMSGYTADVIAHREVLDENVKFIQKPFTMTDLAIKVEQALHEK